MPRFCVLSYRDQSEDPAASTGSLVIALVLFEDNDELQVLVTPRLREVVQEDDWLYLDALFNDFLVRAKMSADLLFQQLRSLQVGPLLTEEVDADLAGYPHLVAITKDFVPYGH